MVFAVVLLDLDGVVRHFDPRLMSAVEARHHLAPGALRAAAFHPHLLERVVTGRSAVGNGRIASAAAQVNHTATIVITCR